MRRVRKSGIRKSRYLFFDGGLAVVVTVAVVRGGGSRTVAVAGEVSVCTGAGRGAEGVVTGFAGGSVRAAGITFPAK
jgi:hypothetical protein